MNAIRMPYQCFACLSWAHNCGHREPELVEHYLGPVRLLEQREQFRRDVDNLRYQARAQKRRMKVGQNES